MDDIEMAANFNWLNLETKVRNTITNSLIPFREEVVE